LSSYNGVESRLEQEFLWYPSSNGSDGKDRRPSGAYIFRPAKLDAVPINIKTTKGPAIRTYVYKGIFNLILFILTIPNLNGVPQEN